jgi:hypothetical protein
MKPVEVLDNAYNSMKKNFIFPITQSHLSLCWNDALVPLVKLK